MKPTAALIDYGMGNLGSVYKALEEAGFKVRLVSAPEGLKEGDAIVLPGVGAFGDAVKNLKRLNLFEAIKEQVGGGKPFLGICLGLQLLFEESEEFGVHRGLGLLPGRVVRFGSEVPKVPHMGWNQIKKRAEHPVLKGIKEGEFFYFVHSFFVKPADESVVLTETDYGTDFTSGVFKENLVAFQFHPEKSQSAGLRLLKNFQRWVKGLT